VAWSDRAWATGFDVTVSKHIRITVVDFLHYNLPFVAFGWLA